MFTYTITAVIVFTLLAMGLLWYYYGDSMTSSSSQSDYVVIPDKNSVHNLSDAPFPNLDAARAACDGWGPACAGYNSKGYMLSSVGSSGLVPYPGLSVFAKPT